MKCGILSSAPLRANDFLVFATDGNSIPFCLYPNIFSRLERTCPIPVRARQTGKLPSIFSVFVQHWSSIHPLLQRNVNGRPQTCFDVKDGMSATVCSKQRPYHQWFPKSWNSHAYQLLQSVFLPHSLLVAVQC